MKTKLYRVALTILNGAALVCLAVTQWGPGIGLSPEIIGLITAVGNGIIVVIRQIGDPTTPTVPPTGGQS